MNTDYRIRVGFFRHLKTRKLERRLGESGIVALLKLWEYATEFRPEGDLSELSDEDLELAIDWRQDAPLIQTLADVGFLDGEEGHYKLHDWIEHNPWVSDSTERSDAARLSRLARKHPETAKKIRDSGRSGITADEYRKYERTTTVERPYNDRTTNRSTPAPAPAPAPDPAPDPAPKEAKREFKDACAAPSAAPNATKKHDVLTLNPDFAWEGITERQRELWKTAYPAVDLDHELAKAAAWIQANPAHRKSNWVRFLNNWLSRSQDQARPTPTTPPHHGHARPFLNKQDRIAAQNETAIAEWLASRHETHAIEGECHEIH